MRWTHRFGLPRGLNRQKRTWCACVMHCHDVLQSFLQSLMYAEPERNKMFWFSPTNWIKTFHFGECQNAVFFIRDVKQNLSIRTFLNFLFCKNARIAAFLSQLGTKIMSTFWNLLQNGYSGFLTGFRCCASSQQKTVTPLATDQARVVYAVRDVSSTPGFQQLPGVDINSNEGLMGHLSPADI